MKTTRKISAWCMSLLLGLVFLPAWHLEAGDSETKTDKASQSPDLQSKDLQILSDALKGEDKSSRWRKMVDWVGKAANPPTDGKYIWTGRSEIEMGLPFAVAGIMLSENGDKELGRKFVDDTLLTLEVCNKVAVDKYCSPEDDPTGGSMGQIAFVMPEVALSVKLLREKGYLQGKELDRTRRMLELVVDHWMKAAPNPGMEGMSNWNNRSGLGALRVANFLRDELKMDSAFAASRPDLKAKLDAYYRYASLAVLAHSDYPYHYRTLPDGSLSEALIITGRERTESPAPADRRKQFGVTENSSGYCSDSVLNLLHMIDEAPPERIPFITPERRKDLCAWLQDWQSLVMPTGAVPSYGDTDWWPNHGWADVFEVAAKMFSDRDKYGDAGSNFKFTAESIRAYDRSHFPGAADVNIAKPLYDTNPGIHAKTPIEKSQIVFQQGPKSNLYPGKVILRSDDGKAFAMFDTFYNSSHSHGHVGCLAAYGVGEDIYQHEMGYDAGEAYFHQMMLVRPADADFLPFAKAFNNPNSTKLRKGVKGLENPGWHSFVSADIDDKPEYSYARIITNYRTSLPEYRRAEFKMVRQAVLIKSTGALMIFDTLLNDRNIKAPFAFSPIWHAQKILDKNAAGFLCQDDYQGIALRKNIKLGAKTRPYWIGMAGPDGFTPEALRWHFINRNCTNDFPQEQHMYLKGSIALQPQQRAGAMTVFVPMPEVTERIGASPADIKVDGGNAQVVYDGKTYFFSPEGITTK